MENISHVNKYFFLRLLLLPIISLSYIFKRNKVLKEAKAYILQEKNIPIEERYEKFLSLFERGLFMKNKTFSFLWLLKISKVQTIFVVNERFSWNTAILLRHLLKKHRHNFATFFLKPHLLKSNFSMSWDLIDVVSDPEDLKSVLHLQRSLLVEKDVFLDDTEVSNIIRERHLPIVPVFYFKFKNKTFYKFGKPLKVKDLIRLDRNALSDTVRESFLNLETEFNKWYKKNNKQFSTTLKELFTLL